jgi:hypothetical protein
VQANQHNRLELMLAEGQFQNCTTRTAKFLLFKLVREQGGIQPEEERMTAEIQPQLRCPANSYRTGFFPL